MLNILLIVQIVIAVLLVIVILLQRTGADGLSGLASGNNMGVVSARAAANFLTRTTMILAALFMINSLVLANLSGKIGGSKKIEQELEADPNKAAPEATSLPVAQ